MKRLIPILLVFMLLGCTSNVSAQSSSKGFDYHAHSKMNKKAGRWSKHRIKAAGNDPTNIQCSVRKSRRKARRAQH